ncbi:MAG: hypothetical protein QOH05_1437 [Acetobacteraceae bacterium]|jgi:ABC-type arginine/histidine transport system permease subunit|nr:hypothetical protein [Acetobacteraceae bacterium]
MIPVLAQLPPGFFPRLLSGMALNFEIAGLALAAGIGLGMPLAFARLAGGVTRAIASVVVALMRAAPTFVVMFFLLNVIPSDLSLFGAKITLSGVMIVALSLVPYSAYYVADNGFEALRQLRLGSPLAALLFLPNLARAFFVLVMASSAGAAIGVTEGISVIVSQSERLPSLADRMELFAIGVLLFAVTLQGGFMIVSILRYRLSHIVIRRMAASP